MATHGLSEGMVAVLAKSDYPNPQRLVDGHASSLAYFVKDFEAKGCQHSCAAHTASGNEAAAWNAWFTAMNITALKLAEACHEDWLGSGEAWLDALAAYREVRSLVPAPAEAKP